MLEADLKLKQDTALFTSPQTPQGKEYWNKLYKKAGELFGTENITIPTLTRPWIVPGEIILRESSDNNSKASQGAYIYKANLKVMLEEDYLKNSNQKPVTSNQIYSFNDPRLKELNQYSTQLIRELILPKLTQKVNSSKDYANLRQVYFSLILARWFKETYKGRFSGGNSLLERTVPMTKLIDSGDLTNLTSKQAWDKTTYFQAYQKSFQEGEYSLSEPVYTPTGQVIRRNMSGGIKIMSGSPLEGGGKFLGNIKELPSIFKKLAGINFESHAWSEISGKTSQPQTEVSKAAGSPLSLEVIKLQMKTIIEKEQLAEQLAKKRIPQIDDNPSYHGLNMIAAGIKQTRNTNEDISNWENIQKWLIQMVRYESEINRFMSTYKRKGLLEPFEKREMDGYFTRNDLISAANKLSSLARDKLQDAQMTWALIHLAKDIRQFMLYGTVPEDSVSALSKIQQIIDTRLGITPENTAGTTDTGATTGTSSSLEITAPAKTGGIDFRQMNILTKPMGSFLGLNFNLPMLSKADIESLDLDKELTDIQRMVNSGIVPSGSRLKEYLSACYQKGEFDSRRDSIIISLAEICNLEESLAKESDPELREAMVMVEWIET